MKLLEQILVAVDLGLQSDDVLATASELAKKFGSKVVLLHVLVPLGAHRPGEERYASLARQAATERLHQLRMHLEHEKVSAEEVVVEGVAFDRIISQAETCNTNVIVVGSGAGAGGSRLGITAERVCRKALKPVWVVSPGGPGFPRSILCPVDFSKPSERALRNALHLARSYAAGLTVLTVIVPPSGVFAWFGRDEESWRHEESTWCESHLADFLGRFDFHGVTCQKLVRCGDPAEQILAVAADQRADLIVMGSAGLTGLSRILLGSVTSSVIRQLPCSIVTVKAKDAFQLHLSEQVENFDTHLRQGIELLEQGLPGEAEREFQRCVTINPMFPPAWEGLAESYQRLHDQARAEQCRRTAKEVLDSLAWREVVADIRREHPFWKGA
jgi:nucleotide-binding universal stress UspA family protein